MAVFPNLSDRVKDYFAKRTPGTPQRKQAWSSVAKKTEELFPRAVQNIRPVAQNINRQARPIVQAAKQTLPTVAPKFGGMVRKGFTGPLQGINPYTELIRNLAGNTAEARLSGFADVVTAGAKQTQGLTPLQRGQEFARGIYGVGKVAAAQNPLFQGMNLLASSPLPIAKTDILRRVPAGVIRGMSQEKGLAPNVPPRNVELSAFGQDIKFDPAMVAGEMAGFVAHPINKALFGATNQTQFFKLSGKIQNFLANNITRGAIEDVAMSIKDMPTETATEAIKFLGVQAVFGAIAETGTRGLGASIGSSWKGLRGLLDGSGKELFDSTIKKATKYYNIRGDAGKWIKKSADWYNEPIRVRDMQGNITEVPRGKAGFARLQGEKPRVKGRVENIDWKVKMEKATDNNGVPVTNIKINTTPVKASLDDALAFAKKEGLKSSEVDRFLMLNAKGEIYDNAQQYSKSGKEFAINIDKLKTAYAKFLKQPDVTKGGVIGKTFVSNSGREFAPAKIIGKEAVDASGSRVLTSGLDSWVWKSKGVTKGSLYDIKEHGSLLAQGNKKAEAIDKEIRSILNKNITLKKLAKQYEATTQRGILGSGDKTILKKQGELFGLEYDKLLRQKLGVTQLPISDIPKGLEELAQEAKGMSKVDFTKKYNYLFDQKPDNFFKGSITDFYKQAQLPRGGLIRGAELPGQAPAVGATKIKGASLPGGAIQQTQQPRLSQDLLKQEAQVSKKIAGSSEEIIQQAKKEINAVSKKGKSVKQSFDDFYTSWVNKFHPIEKVAKQAERLSGSTIIPKKSPVYAIDRLYGAGGVAELRHKQRLQPIIDSLGDIAKDDFDVFLKASRDVELAGRGIKGSDAVRAKEIIKALGGKYNLSQLNKTARQLYKYQSQNLEMLRKSGFLSDKAVADITGVNKKYVPFDRIMDDLDDYLGIPTSKAQQTTTPIKRIKGSKRPIYSPLESIIANTYKTEAAIAKNRVATSIADLPRVAPELGKIIKKIRVKMAPVAKEGDKIIFRPSAFEPKAPHITVWENGKKVFYQVPEEVEAAVKGLNEENMGTLVEILSAPARLLRQGATGRNIDFMIPNVFRDQFDAAVNSEYGYKPFMDYFIGLAHMVNFRRKGTDEIIDKWIKGGGKIFFENMAGRKSIKKQILSATKRKSIGKRIGEWAIGGLDVLGRYSEEPTRVGLFKKAFKKTGSVELGVHEARQSTLDFARMGSKMKVLNSVIPFLNVGVQGFDRLIRTAARNPKQAVVRMAMYAGIPQLAISLYNNLYHREDYAQVPDFVKQNNFTIMTGEKDDNDQPIYITIPKGHIVELIANPTDNLVTWLADNNPQTFGQMALSNLSSALPVIEEGNTLQEVISRTVGSNLPQAIKPTAEGIANYSFFKGKPIVPWYMERKDPEEQVYKTTPAPYKKVGQLIGASPLKVKNFLEGSLAGFAKTPVNIIESAAGRGNVNTIPVARRFRGSYEGFDIERPEEKEDKKKKGGFLRGLLKPTEEAVAAEVGQPLPRTTTELETLYKDSASVLENYQAKKTRIKYGQYEDEDKREDAMVDLEEKHGFAKEMNSRIREERPEQIFEFEVDTYKSGGGQVVESRAKWAVDQVKGLSGEKRQQMINELWDTKVLTGTASGTAAHIKENFGIDVGKYTGTKKGKGTKAKVTKAKKPAKVTYKKVSAGTVSTARPSFQRPAAITEIKKARIVKPEVSNVQYSL